MKNSRYGHFIFPQSLLLCLVLFAGGAIAAIPISSQTKLVADDALRSSGFGWAVAIDDNTAVVSAFADDDNIGAAYVYERSGSGWQQVSKLTASDGEAGDFLGISVAVSGDTIALGAALDDNEKGADAGAVYIYVKPANGWAGAMTETLKLAAASGNADRGFGGSVALAGNTLVVGAPGKDSATTPGEVFVYQGSGATWSQKAKLDVADLDGSDFFGAVLDFDGETIAVGAFGKDGNKGAVYLYGKPAGGWSDKEHDAVLTADDGVANDYFGGSVAVDGATVLVGANGKDGKLGAAYLFGREGGNWVQQAKLLSADGAAGDNFGYAVGVAGDTAVVSASHFMEQGSESFYLFTRSGNSWVEQGKISDPDGKSGSKFAQSIAIDKSARSVVVGAFSADAGQDRAEKNTGAAYLFELEQPVDLALVKQDGTDPVLVGEQITYSLLVTNNSGRDATGVTVTDTLPAGLGYVSDDGGCAVSGQTVNCNLGTVTKNGGTGSVAITARANSAGKITNTATVSANEADANNSDNTDTEETTVKKNTPPVAGDDTAVTEAGSAVTTGNVLANDSDADGDALAVSGADTRSAQGGSVVDNGDGTFTYTPPDGFDGEDSFGYTVSDGKGGEAQGTVRITVEPVNNPPSAADDSVTTDEDTPVTTGNVLANDTDPDGDSLSVSGVDGRSARGGTVADNGNGTFTYTPPAGFDGEDSFGYTVSDGNGGEAQGTVRITVEPVNNPPSAADDSVTTDEDTPVTTGNVLANDTDPDGDSLSVSGVDGRSARGGTVVDNGNGTFTYTPPAGFSGNDNFRYTVSDGKGGEARGTVQIAVNTVNEAPQAGADSISTTEGNPVTTGNVLANDTDPDGDSLSVSGVDGRSAQGGTVVDNGDGTFTYTPPAGFSGTDSFAYTVSDGKGGEAQGTVNVTVTKVVPINNPPVAENDSATTMQDTPVTIAVLANDSDPDGDTVTVKGVDETSAQGGSVVDNGDGSFTYTPVAGYAGSDSFNYMIGDGKGGQAQGRVDITVERAASGNEAPQAVDDNAATDVDTAVTITDVLANDSDADGDPLSIIAVDSESAQGGSVVDNGDGSFTYTPPTGYSGADTFTYTISDGNGGEATGTVTISVGDGDGVWQGALDPWMLLLLLLPLGYRRFRRQICDC